MASENETQTGQTGQTDVPSAVPPAAVHPADGLAVSTTGVPERSPSRSSTRSGTASHRQSFVENLRNPPSPRAPRHISFTQQVQDLVNNPPPRRQANPRFVGRDWQDIAVGELVSGQEVRWTEMDTTVEECTKILLKNNSTGTVLLRAHPSDKTAVATFDHRDLNAYLLVVIGRAKPEPAEAEVYRSIAERAYGRVGIPVRDIQPICHKEPTPSLSSTQTLPSAIGLFGSGARRILITDGDSPDVVGVLSPLRLLEFFWTESVNFPSIDRLYPALLRDLRLGSQDIISINADRPLAEALTLMNDEGLTSVAVVDNGQNVVGNISTTDIEHLTSVARFPLLHSSCMHFISVILSERGVEEGRDSFPVFYVNPHSTLAHTVAKLVATRSHRMWIVDASSPVPSAPQTPLLAPATSGASGSTSLISPPAQRSRSRSTSTTHSDSADVAAAAAASISVTTNPVMGHGAHGHGSVPASAMPGAHLSGKLAGVVSLTDILNLFAKSSGLRPSELADIRARRRRSSSSSVRPSLDGSRTSIDIIRR